MIGQPNPVSGEIKIEPLIMHALAVDSQQEKFAVANSDFASRLRNLLYLTSDLFIFD